VEQPLEIFQRASIQGSGQEAFTGAEEARARPFTEMVSEARAAQSFARSNNDPAFRRLFLAEWEACLRAQGLVRKAEETRVRPGGRHSGGEAPCELMEAQRTCREAADRVRSAHPRYADLKDPSPLRFKEVQSLLGPDEGVLRFFVGEARSGIRALDHRQARLIVIPVGRAADRRCHTWRVKRYRSWGATR
jgi:hypothetical protein